MTDFKSLWIDSYEEIAADLMDENPGMTEAEAYALAEDRAYDHARDRLADMADNLRQWEKDENQ